MQTEELSALLAYLCTDRGLARGEAMAHRILSHTDGLHGLARALPEELMVIEGIGPRRAARICAALELGRRVQQLRDQKAIEYVRHVGDVDTWARPRLATLEHEEVWLLSLTARHQLKRADQIAKGGVSGCALLPRDVLRPAVRCGAAAAILVHNHPSGDGRPSEADVAVTAHLLQAFSLVGVELLDHVVVGATRSHSIAEHYADVGTPWTLGRAAE